MVMIQALNGAGDTKLQHGSISSGFGSFKFHLLICSAGFGLGTTGLLLHSCSKTVIAIALIFILKKASGKKLWYKI